MLTLTLIICSALLITTRALQELNCEQNGNCGCTRNMNQYEGGPCHCAYSQCDQFDPRAKCVMDFEEIDLKEFYKGNYHCSCPPPPAGATYTFIAIKCPYDERSGKKNDDRCSDDPDKRCPCECFKHYDYCLVDAQGNVMQPTPKDLCINGNCVSDLVAKTATCQCSQGYNWNFDYNSVFVHGYCVDYCITDAVGNALSEDLSEPTPKSICTSQNGVCVSHYHYSSSLAPHCLCSGNINNDDDFSVFESGNCVSLCLTGAAFCPDPRDVCQDEVDGTFSCCISDIFAHTMASDVVPWYIADERCGYELAKIVTASEVSAAQQLLAGFIAFIAVIMLVSVSVVCSKKKEKIVWTF